MKASVLVLLALAAIALMRTKSAAVRHWVLSAAILCAAATPLLELIVPAWHVALGSSPSIGTVAPSELSVTASHASQSAPAVAVQQTASSSDRESPLAPVPATSVRSLLVLLWMVGAGISVSVLLVGLGRLAWLASRARRLDGGPWVDIARDISRKYGLRRAVRLLQSDHPTLLVTWGLVRPKVILPRGAGAWPDDRVRIVLSHELAHIQRGDWLMQMIAEVLRSVYWFNPLLWIAGRRLRQESEHACDDAVLSLGVEGPEYAGHLLDLARDVRRCRARWSPSLPAPAIARPSSLERRVSAMLNGRLNHGPLSRSARLVAAIALSSVTIPLAGFGQAAFVTFSGSVVDPFGRIVPGVTLVLTSVQREARHEVRTDGTGRFEFVGLPAGEYSLEARFLGFTTLHERLSLAGRSVQRNLSLEVGSVEETITLTADGNRSSSSARSAYRRAPLPVAANDPCSASPVGGCLKPPTKVTDVRPVYPPHLDAAKVEGQVILEARIRTDGSTLTVNVVDSNDPAFAAAAVAAVNQWRFTPTQLGGVPIETRMNVTVNFKGNW